MAVLTNLTAAQHSHWTTMGFLHIPSLLAATELASINSAFHSVMETAALECGLAVPLPPMLGGALVVDQGFAERVAPLRRLSGIGPDADHCLVGLAQQLLGDGVLYAGSDGVMAVGDTGWHVDKGWSPAYTAGRDAPGHEDNTGGQYWEGIKAVFYLDPLTRGTGSLRVIPGSHLSPYHELLGRIHQEPAFVAPDALGGANGFGVLGSEVPAHALETQPGDCVLFSSQMWHGASNGGAYPRRFFALGWMSKPLTRGQHRRAAMYAERTAADRASARERAPLNSRFEPASYFVAEEGGARPRL
jgi:hypothetical protein